MNRDGCPNGEILINGRCLPESRKKRIKMMQGELREINETVWDHAELKKIEAKYGLEQEPRKINPHPLSLDAVNERIIDLLEENNFRQYDELLWFRKKKNNKYVESIKAGNPSTDSMQWAQEAYRKLKQVLDDEP
jgi:hypothetical protein